MTGTSKLALYSALIPSRTYHEKRYAGYGAGAVVRPTAPERSPHNQKREETNEPSQQDFLWGKTTPVEEKREKQKEKELTDGFMKRWSVIAQVNPKNEKVRRTPPKIVAHIRCCAIVKTKQETQVRGK